MTVATPTHTSSLSPTYTALLNLITPDLVSYAISHLPNESVCLISSTGRICPLINQRRSPHQFMVSLTLIREALEEIHSRGESAVAIFHSHPNQSADPSETDFNMMCQADDTVFIILGTDRIGAFIWVDVDKASVEIATLDVDRWQI